MVARIVLGVGFFALIAAVPVPVLAQEDPPAEEIIPEVIINDDSPETTETSMGGVPTGEGGDVATVINPESSSSGKVEVIKDNDEYVEVKRSGAVVERIQLVADESGCLQGLGQIGSVNFCTSGSATLDLIGRPPYACPNQDGVTFGPCEVQGS